MAPTLYRIILQVDNLDKAEEFYGKLLGDRGRRIPRASRHYIDCGPVTLALVDVNGENIPGLQPKPLPDYIY
ncbi:MAG TPA: VOC family protein, partial [Pyrinomonadaceae bacterium]|nr:VOC family protein [Pyrinomonadaceae bacterium]